MRDKDKVLIFRVNQKELDRINAKREEISIRNMGAYLRKMAMDGYCANLKLKDVKELVQTADEEFLLPKRQYEHITGRTQKHNVIAYQIRQSFKPGEVSA